MKKFAILLFSVFLLLAMGKVSFAASHDEGCHTQSIHKEKGCASHSAQAEKTATHALSAQKTCSHTATCPTGNCAKACCGVALLRGVPSLAQGSFVPLFVLAEEHPRLLPALSASLYHPPQLLS